MCGVCIFLLFKHHKKVKNLLQSFLPEIPEHYQEVHIHILELSLHWDEV